MFTAEGACVAVHVPQQGAKGACASGDTLHVLPYLMSLRKHSTTAYSMDLHEIGSARIPVPKHPILYNSSGSMPGRAIECFGDGPYYVFAGRIDAVQVRTPGDFTPAHPPFFVKRAEDLPGGAGSAGLLESVMKYPMNFGVFKIDRQTRLVAYWIPREQLAATPGTRLGFVVASNIGAFAARSTMSPIDPVGAADEYIYGYGDNEQMPDGEVANPVLLRYKFIPPSDASF
ncbi:MAG: hypothetical protein OXM02_05890 [Bacteroidota bacterium]|nr:hypothetical protein [Bacteroidota bacterium]